MLNMTNEKDAQKFCASLAEKCSLYRIELLAEDGRLMWSSSASGMLAAKGFSTPHAGKPPANVALPVIK